MDREFFYSLLQEDRRSDYEIYVNTGNLLACQKDYADLCNKDELQFQMVHQLQEMYMKLIVYTLLDIDEEIQGGNTHRVVSLFARVGKFQKLMIDGLELLETMSPKEYQEIRLRLGNGSGITSPGFRTIIRLFRPLWDSYEKHYLSNNKLTLGMIYGTQFSHDSAYVVAEALVEFDTKHRLFLRRHFDLIERTIGGNSKSLKGRDVTMLRKKIDAPIFPELWQIRNAMTNEWGTAYGIERERLTQTPEKNLATSEL